MTTEPVWVPAACTLPTAEQPLRVAEFDALFASGLRDVRRVDPTRLRLVFDPQVERRARDLIALEIECCTFFAFTVRAEPGELTIDVDVSQDQRAALDGVAARAAAARPAT